MQKNKRILVNVLEGLGTLLLVIGTLFIRSLFNIIGELELDEQISPDVIGVCTVGLGMASLLGAFAWRFYKNKGDTHLQSAYRIVMGTGFLSIIAGSFYLPWVPWYMLGDEAEQEITAWGKWSIWGGIAAYWGSILLMRVQKGWKQYLLFTGGVGVFLMTLAQVLPIYLYIRYWGHPIAETALVNPTIGGILPMLPHLLLGAVCVYSMVTISGLLWRRSSEIRLTKKQLTVITCSIIVLAIGWFCYDSYEDMTWVTVTSPVNGAVDVPLQTTINVKWKDRRDNGGINVYYADDPAKNYIPAMSGFSMEGMTYISERPFLPGKKIIVEVQSGRRQHTFSFTTGYQ